MTGKQSVARKNSSKQITRKTVAMETRDAGMNRKPDRILEQLEIAVDNLPYSQLVLGIKY